MEGNTGEEADSHAVAAVPVVVSVLWVLFCFFYHTRLLAVILSWLVNWLSPDTHIKIGTFLFTKLMAKFVYDSLNVHLYHNLDHNCIYY